MQVFRSIYLVSVGVVFAAVSAVCGDTVQPLRPPAVPLVVIEPYFSTWSFSDHAFDTWPKHWTGTNHSMAGMIRIDGRTWRFMGLPESRLPPVEQLSVDVHATRTIYRFAAGGVELKLTFLTPALPEDLDVMARP